MSAREFIRSLGLENGVLASLRAAIDASYTQPTLIHSVAGYVAPPEAWDAVLPFWQKAVDLWRIPRFHFAELPKLVGHERTPQCEGYFRRIVEGSALHAFGGTIFEEDYNNPDWGDDGSPRFDTAYQQALWFAFTVLGEHCEAEFPNKEIAVVCDLDGAEGDILAVFKRSKEKHPNLGAIAFSGWRERPELQLADLAAGFLRRSWEDIASNPESSSDWGRVPRGKDGRERTSVWSLRQGALISRMLAPHLPKGTADRRAWYETKLAELDAFEAELPAEERGNPDSGAIVQIVSNTDKGEQGS